MSGVIRLPRNSIHEKALRVNGGPKQKGQPMTISTAHSVAEDMPPALFSFDDDGDTPRARRSDPIASHLAADQSQQSIHIVKHRVLMLVRQEGEITGRDLNDLYRARGDRLGWDRISFDSPRKRAAELYEAGELIATNEDAKRGVGRIYALKAVHA